MNFVPRWVFLAARGLSPVVVRVGFSYCETWTLEHQGSVAAPMWALVAAPGLSCSAANGILIPQPGIEPASPALESGVLTTEPPGKSPDWAFLMILLHVFY